MTAVNSMDYSGKDTVLDVIKKESSDFFKLVDDPKNWKVQTRCTEWETRDVVGHINGGIGDFIQDARWQLDITVIG